MPQVASLGTKPLKGKVAVVTGAGQGIGREAARVLARHGASVVIAEVTDKGAQTEATIKKEGGTALFVKTDVSDPKAMERLRKAALDAFGKVDILVNNAAAYTIKPLLETTPEEWDRVFAVNQRGAYLGIRAFLPGMLDRKEGVIVTFESADAMPYLASYMASKVGLRSLATSLGGELGESSGVHVFCFGAGMVETPGGTAAFRAMAPRLGLSYHEFIRQSFGGLVSPEVCAMGLLGAILNARDFHGGEADFFTGLAKLGLDRNGQPLGGEAPKARAGPLAPPAVLVRAKPRPGDALTASRQVAQHAAQMASEVHQLPLYARPIVKRMFSADTGMKLDEWELITLEVVQALERGALEPACARVHAERLGKVVTYLRKQERDAPGWIADKEMLAKSMSALGERIDAAQAAREHIEGMAGAHMAPPA